MGFDIVGINPKNKKGEYFRNNVWWWRRLADFVIHVSEDILTVRDAEQFKWNNGYKISKRKAEKIAKRLKEAINDKKAHKKFLKEQVKAYTELSKKIAKEGESAWQFSWKNIKEFAEFCENSGGFWIG